MLWLSQVFVSARKPIDVGGIHNFRRADLLQIVNSDPCFFNK